MNIERFKKHAIRVLSGNFLAINVLNYDCSSLLGVVFNPVVDGEIKPPIQQSNLNAEELVEKEKAVFDKAMTELKSYWEGVCFDGHDVSTKITKTNSDQLLFDDYENVKNFLKCPIRDLHKFSNLSTEYKCMFKHIDRHANEVIFMKCDKRCCGEWESAALKEFLEKFKMMLFAPTSTTCGHYDTFLQSSIKVEHVFGSSGQPSVVKDDLGKCDHCPNYHFKSKTERERHQSLFHRRQKVQQQRPRSFVCNVCEASFESLSSLNRHKKEKKHTRRDQGRKRKNGEAPSRNTKARTIQDMLRANPMIESEDAPSDSEEGCSASECIINTITVKKINWIECETCSKWFHIYCVTKEEAQTELDNFICNSCSKA